MDGARTLSHLGLRLTPHGRLLLEHAEDAPLLADGISERLGAAFARSTGDGLLRLGAGEVGQALPPAFTWWRDFAARYVGGLCLHASGLNGDLPTVPLPDEGELATLVLTAPMMPGAEYLTADILAALWAELG